MARLEAELRATRREWAELVEEAGQAAVARELRTMLMPSDRSTSSKVPENLRSRSWIRNVGERPSSWRAMARFRPGGSPKPSPGSM